MKPTLRKLIVPFVFIAMAWSGWVHAADPPSRVARLAYVSGTASFSPGGERDWGRAVVNRPLITGDRLWVERGARAELQLGSAAIRVGASTSLTLLNLDDRIAQVELTQGTLNIRVRRLDRGQVFEVDTPNLAYSIRRPGSYRIQVDTDGVTTVTVRSGQADVYGEGRAFLVRDRQAMRFYDSGLRDYETFASWPVDEFERWSSQRDRSWDNSPSRRYVSAELIGYQDLDQYGTWRQDREYGSVWVPNRVAADWAPYRDGHWSWVEPWGWTWVDEAPWGFASSHYGRWAYVGNSWAWVPGPVKAQPVYAPALVAFVAGSNLQSGGGGGGGGAVGWFPLGPRDVYRPSYTASREYFNTVNTSNTVITQVNVSNYYDNRNTSNVTYANQQVPGAVIAVLAAAFIQSRPVARETVRVSREMVAKAPVAAVAPVAPVLASVVPPATQQIARPPERTHSRPVVAQTAPPPPPVAFAAKESALAANAGKPLDTAAVAALKPAAPASAPAVKVVQPSQPVAAPAKPASAPTAAAIEAAASAPARARPSAEGASSPRRSSAAAAAAASQAGAPAPASAASAPASPAAVPAPGSTPPQTPSAPARQASAAAGPSAAAPGAAASSAREGRRQRSEDESGARGRPGPAGQSRSSDADRSQAPSAPATSAVPATPATPAAPAAPATPAARATPTAPATPATPASRATPATPPAPAAAPTPVTPPPQTTPAPPARAATPSTPATPATPAAPPVESAPSRRPAAPAAAAPEEAPRGRNAQGRGRDAGDEANRPAADAPRSGPPPGRPVPPVAAPAPATPPAAPAAAAPAAAPRPAAAPPAAPPPAAAPPARAASADAPAAASQRRGPRSADEGAAPGKREAASAPGAADERRRRRGEEESKP